MLRTCLDALALQRASKTGTRDAIEGEIEHQEMVLQQDFGKRAEMAFGIGIADAEVGLGLHTERVGEEIVGAEQHIFFEAFDVDLEKIELRNPALGKKRVQTADRHRAGLFARRHFETTSSLHVHRAGGGICRIEMEHPFLVGTTRRDAMVISVRHVAGAFPQLIYGFLDRVESVDDEVIAEAVPGWTLAALNADVDEHEGLTQQARLHHPVGEFGVGIGKQIHPLLRLTLRGAARRLRYYVAAREELKVVDPSARAKKCKMRNDWQSNSPIRRRATVAALDLVSIPRARRVAGCDKGGDAADRERAREPRRMPFIGHLDHLERAAALAHGLDGCLRQNVGIGAANHHCRYAAERVELLPQG